MQSYRSAAAFGAGVAAAAVLTAGGLAIGAAVALSLINSVRPPMPAPFGTVAMAYECGFSVAGVERRRTMAGRRAHGEFYVVSGRIVCPFGERYAWTPQSVFVASNGRGASIFADLTATRALDPRAVEPHRVRGASERRRLVFDLPLEAEQPALVFADTVAPGALVEAWTDLKIYEPRRFNLRDD